MLACWLFESLERIWGYCQVRMMCQKTKLIVESAYTSCNVLNDHVTSSYTIADAGRVKSRSDGTYL
jgi:hypothetical protein